MTTSTLVRTRFPSAVLVAVGLAAGFGIAQGTGIRALGGAVFAVAGVAAGVLWLRRRGLATSRWRSRRSTSAPSCWPTCWRSASGCRPGWR